MSLQTLPNETILQILDLIPDQIDLVRCSETSHWFHELTEPVLYSKFVERDIKALALLLRSIEHNPGLAKYVKDVELCELKPRNVPIISSPNDLIRYGPWCNLKSMLQAFFTTCAKEWDSEPIPVDEQVSLHMSRMTCEDNWDVLASVLPMILSNLETLRVISHTSNGNNILRSLERIGDMQRSSLPFVRNSSHSLPRLRELSIAVWDPEGEQQFQLEDMMLLLRIPSVTVFSCDGLAEEDAFEGTDFVLPTKELTLRATCLSHISLGKVLQGCKNLEKLHIGYSDYCGDSDHAFSDDENFFHCLQRVQTTLLSLVIIDEDNWWDSTDYSDEEWTPLSSVARLSKLQSLEVSSQLLLGKRVHEHPRTNLAPVTDDTSDEGGYNFAFAHLPASLVHLTLHNTRDDVVDKLLELDFHLLPNLRMVRINFWELALPVEESLEWQNVFKRYREHGIVIEYAYDMAPGNEPWLAPEIAI